HDARGALLGGAAAARRGVRARAGREGVGMRIDGVAWRTISLADDGRSVRVIDQTRLPHRFQTLDLRRVWDAARAIRAMHVRGAPLIGVAAAWGLYFACREDASDEGLQASARLLAATRP